jgi:hypothetical protein
MLLIFLVLLLGKEAPCCCRALARHLQATTTPLAVELVTKWNLPRERTQLEIDFKKLLDVNQASVVHWLLQHGLVKPAAVAEMKRLVLEQPSSRTSDRRVFYHKVPTTTIWFGQSRPVLISRTTADPSLYEARVCHWVMLLLRRRRRRLGEW